MDDIKKTVDNIIMKRKNEDPKGFAAAEKRNDIKSFIREELMKNRINPDLLDIPSISNTERINRSNNNPIEDIDMFVKVASDMLDQNIYESYYQNNLKSNHMYIADAVSAIQSSRKINLFLRRTKVVFAVTSFLSLSMTLRNASRGSSGVMPCIIYGVLALDFLRISYNCYHKNYCQIALHRLVSDTTKLTQTIFKAAQSMIGMTEGNIDNPLQQIKDEIIIGVLVENTFIIKPIYEKAIELIRKAK
eukprot:gene11315-15177_t